MKLIYIKAIQIIQSNYQEVRHNGYQQLEDQLEILILDEAFSNLDKENATKAMKTVLEYGKNKIVIDITHNIGEANGYKQIYELKNGQLFAKKIKSKDQK